MSNATTTVNSTETTATAEKHVPSRINVEEPMPFEGTTENMMVTSLDLMEIVNGLFRPAFKDYAGCSFNVNNNMALADPSLVSSLTPDGYLLDVPAHAIYINLYFKENPDTRSDGFTLLRRIGETKNGETGMLSRVNSIFGTPRHKTYEMTEEGKEVLSEFMFNPSNPRWDRHVHESTEINPTTGHQYIIHVRISGLDLNRILCKMYGDKDQNGESYQYNVSVSNMISAPSGQIGNFLLNIARANVHVITRLSHKLGMGAPTSVGYVSI